MKKIMIFLLFSLLFFLFSFTFCKFYFILSTIFRYKNLISANGVTKNNIDDDNNNNKKKQKQQQHKSEIVRTTMKMAKQKKNKTKLLNMRLFFSSSAHFCFLLNKTYKFAVHTEEKLKKQQKNKKETKCKNEIKEKTWKRKLRKKDRNGNEKCNIKWNWK